MLDQKCWNEPNFQTKDDDDNNNNKRVKERDKNIYKGWNKHIVFIWNEMKQSILFHYLQLELP